MNAINSLTTANSSETINEKMILLVISCAMFMESLDSTILNSAVPAIANNFHIEPINLKVALISYLISLAVFIPISGWVADKFGTKQVFLSAIGIFTISSIYCGLANNLTTLVIARVMQGLGASMMRPVGRLILLRMFGRDRLVEATNKVVTVGALGALLGPVLSGVILSQLSWHWIFWVNIPVGIIAVVMVVVFFEQSAPVAVPKLDKIGFGLSGVGLSALTFGLSALSDDGISHLISAMILLVAALALGGYFLYSRKTANPIIDLDLFRYRTFRVSMLAGLFSRVGFGGIPFLLPLLLQLELGFSVQLAGMLIMPIAIGSILTKQVTKLVLNRWGYKRVLLVNTVAVSLSLWSFALINHSTSAYLIIALAFIYGVLLSMQYSAMNSLAYMQLPQNKLSAATSITSTMQQVTASFGVATSVLLLHICAGLKHSNAALNLANLHITFIGVGTITLLALILIAQLKPEDGHKAI